MKYTDKYCKLIKFMKKGKIYKQNPNIYFLPYCLVCILL